MANEKVSYEELEKKVQVLELMGKQQEMQFNNQKATLMNKMQSLYEALAYRRLEFLFKVVEHSDKFPSDFVITCTDEIVKNMTIPEKEEVEDKEE